MAPSLSTKRTLERDLQALGLCESDGVFVHASMKSIGAVVGGPRAFIEALFSVVGSDGLVVMPGFSTDAYFPADIDPAHCSPADISEIKAAVPGFDIERSLTSGMGVIAEAFRTWPNTVRSAHPAVSVCLNGLHADHYASEHSLGWATGSDTPFGRLRERPAMKMLLVGVGWNRCTALHTAESLADPKRTKIRRLKIPSAPGEEWVEVLDVADDLDRLFPFVGKAFEETGTVTRGQLGRAETRICEYGPLISFAAPWLGRANAKSGDRH